MEIVVGLYSYLKGVGLIWRNSLTRYYLTKDDFLYMYRFLGEQTTETPLEQIADIDTSRNFVQQQLGVGDVVVHSESGGSTPSITRSVGSPRQLNQQVSDQRRVTKDQNHGSDAAYADDQSSTKTNIETNPGSNDSNIEESADHRNHKKDTQDGSRVSIDQLITEIGSLSTDIAVNDF